MLLFLAIVGAVLLVALVALVRTILQDGIDAARTGVADWAAGTTLTVPRSVRAAR